MRVCVGVGVGELVCDRKARNVNRIKGGLRKEERSRRRRIEYIYTHGGGGREWCWRCWETTWT